MSQQGSSIMTSMPPIWPEQPKPRAGDRMTTTYSQMQADEDAASEVPQPSDIKQLAGPSWSSDAARLTGLERPLGYDINAVPNMEACSWEPGAEGPNGPTAQAIAHQRMQRAAQARLAQLFANESLLVATDATEPQEAIPPSSAAGPKEVTALPSPSATLNPGQRPDGMPSPSFLPPPQSRGFRRV